MPQTTFGVPYPDPTEPVAEGAARIRDVAEALDSKVLAGRIDWGPAGAPDTNLYRSGPDALYTDDTFSALQFIANNGVIYFGSQIDTNLYRGGAGVLTTSGQLNVGAGALEVGISWPGLPGPGIYFGQAGDTKLYRSAPAQLSTDGELTVRNAGGARVALGDVIGGGQPGILFGSAADTSLYRRAANVLKTGGRLEVGQLGLGNVTPPAAQGAPVGRFVVYDVADNALGFVYIYAS